MRRPTTPVTEQVYVIRDDAGRPAAARQRTSVRGAPRRRLGRWPACRLIRPGVTQTRRPAPARLAGIDRVVEGAIAAGQTPGAVVLVGRGDARSCISRPTACRATVPVPGADDSRYGVRPGVAYQGRGDDHGGDDPGGTGARPPERPRVDLRARVRALREGRRHRGTPDGSHLRASGPTWTSADPWKGYDTAIELACDEVLTSAPGERFVYSDINYFLLGEIVRVTSGEPLDGYTRKVVFDPLAMRDTGFLPAERLRARIAPTERCDEMDQWPCKRPGRGAAARRGARSDRPSDGWRRWPRRAVRHGLGSGAVCPDAAGGRGAGWRAGARAAPPSRA